MIHSNNDVRIIGKIGISVIFHQGLIHSSGKLRRGSNDELLANLVLFCYLSTEPKNYYSIRGVN